MIEFDEALKTVKAAASPLGTEEVPLSTALGRVLARDAVADLPMPPFDRSAMDGFAVRLADVASPLLLSGEVAAGAMPQATVNPGTCVRIMTGAPVPEGADGVVMVEDTHLDEEGRVVVDRTSGKSNIRKRGEDVAAGAKVLSAGQLIGPAQVASLAAVGIARPLVYKVPKVAVLATGNELVGVEEVPVDAQIRDSNTPQLLAQLAAIGVPARANRVVADSLEQTCGAIEEAMAQADVLLMTGGVSMGRYDFVPQALKQCGFDLRFQKVAMQPGKPTVFGTGVGQWCFGLPGNPVSAFVVFERLVKPFLFGVMGAGSSWSPVVQKVVLTGGFSRKKARRECAVPVLVDDGGAAMPVRYMGSAHLTALGVANGYVVVPAGVSEILDGATVEVVRF